MPEIVEAQTLLAALMETEEVKTAIAQRRRRLDLQASYGQALLWGKGFAAKETEAAFARVGELAGQQENPAARFVASYAQCVGRLMRGEFPQAQEMAETFLREAEVSGRAAEAGAARRLLASVLLFQGDLRAARSFFERALPTSSQTETEMRGFLTFKRARRRLLRQWSGIWARSSAPGCLSKRRSAAPAIWAMPQPLSTCSVGAQSAATTSQPPASPQTH